MKTVFLTCGPRGAGKTTYCATQHPSLPLISRDAYLVSLYGSTMLADSPSRDHKINLLILDALAEAITHADTVILDYWNRTSPCRISTITTLRDQGFERVICWYFVTPVETCMRWIQQKKDSDYAGEQSYRNKYRLFHKDARSVRTDGFDEVVELDPICTEGP